MKATSLQEYIRHLRDVLSQDMELEETADELGSMGYSFDIQIYEDSELYWNYKALCGYAGWFSFGWREEAYGAERSKDEFLSKGTGDIKQMLADIDANILYHPVFKVKTVYTDNEWAGEEMWQDIDARTVDQAKNLADDIRTKSPKRLEDQPDKTLSDVILVMEIHDSHGGCRYKANIEPEYGAYFTPRQKR